MTSRNGVWVALLVLSLAGTALAAEPPQVPLTNYKCGISLKVLGTPGKDYAFERFYSDPKVDDHGVVYVRSDARITLEHNEQNLVMVSRDKFKVVGPNGADGKPDSGDEGIIRMKPDMDHSWRFHWANGNSDKSSVAEERRVPRYAGPFTFASLTYFDGTKVLGGVGPSKGAEQENSTDPDFYHRGQKDEFGDEWHALTVGDDDEQIPGIRVQKYDTWSSDGRVFLFVVDPKTPAIGFLADAAAQYYTTAAKTYFVPHIHPQTTYLTRGVSFFFTNLTDPAQSVRWRIDEVHQDAWQTYAEPVRVDALGLKSDTAYTLRYRIGAEGPVKVRRLHFEPSYPSDREPHPSPVLFKDQAMLAIIRRNIETRPEHRSIYAAMLRNAPAEGPSQAFQGLRTFAGEGGSRDAFIILLDGLGKHPRREQAVREGLLDNLLALDPVGHEILHNLANPCRERVQYGYYYAGTVLNIALAYDLSIRQLRPGKSPQAITAIEDLKIRDFLGSFAMETMIMRSEFPLPSGILPITHVDPADIGMWDSARYLALQVVSMIMPTYDSPCYGTSGAGGRTKATHPFTPFEKTPVTWFDESGRHVPEHGPLPKVDPPIWADRCPYFDMMIWLYATQANARANFDGTRLPHVELACRMAAEGTLKPGKVSSGDPDRVRWLVDLMMNETFGDLCRLTEEKFAAAEAIAAANAKARQEGRPEQPLPKGSRLGEAMYGGVFSLCYCRPLTPAAAPAPAAPASDGRK